MIERYQKYTSNGRYTALTEHQNANTTKANDAIINAMETAKNMLKMFNIHVGFANILVYFHSKQLKQKMRFMKMYKQKKQTSKQRYFIMFSNRTLTKLVDGVNGNHITT